MRELADSARQPVLLFMSIGSLLAAGAVLWSWIDADTIQKLTTLQLFGVLGLFVLPVATLAAVEIDRRYRQAHGRREDDRATASHAAHAVPVPVTHRSTVVLRPDARSQPVYAVRAQDTRQAVEPAPAPRRRHFRRKLVTPQRRGRSSPARTPAAPHR